MYCSLSFYDQDILMNVPVRYFSAYIFPILSSGKFRHPTVQDWVKELLERRKKQNSLTDEGSSNS